MSHVWQEPKPDAGTLPPVTETVARTSALDRQLLPVAVLAAASVIAAAMVLVLLLHWSGTTSTALPPPNGGPALVTPAQLQRLAASSSRPIYWAGPRPGYSYELTRTSSGRTYIRYLPGGVKAGDPRAGFLVVGTYAQPGSFANLQRAAKAPGALSLRIANDGLVVFSSSRPTSVYLGYPGASYQVEVYAPSGDAARSLVLAGKIRPVP
jgi:hypothetical protein